MADFTISISTTFAPNTVIASSPMNTILQTDIRDKYNAAMNVTTGHTHDGSTAGNGPKLTSSGLDMTAAYTWTGIHTFDAAELKVKGAGAGVAALQNVNTADSRTLTLPDPGAASTLVALAGAQTFTGAKTFSGADTLVVPTAAPTVSAAVGSLNGTIQLHDGTAARIYAPMDKMGTFFWNLSIARATTTNAGDSVKITGFQGTALGATNPGYIILPHTTAGQYTMFTVTADVTILLSGAHWGMDALGNITGALLRVLAINDNGTLRWGVAYLGGRTTLLTTDTTATQSDINLPEEVLCTAAVSSATNRCREIGYVRADFTDATNVWGIQSGINDVVTGESPDGIWQPFNPDYTGFSANPTVVFARMTQVGRIISIQLARNAAGTASGTGFGVICSVKARNAIRGAGFISDGIDNSADVTTAGVVATTAGSKTLSLFRDPSGLAWTNANTKAASFSASFEVGPSASFIE